MILKMKTAMLKKVLKVLKHENIFITFGMLAFLYHYLMNVIFFSIEDKTISLSSEEFQKYGDLKEEYFGVLIEKKTAITFYYRQL